jgi:hypothetical protein
MSSTHTNLDFAGTYKAGHAPGNVSDTRSQVPASPAIHLCPKCGTAMRQYRRNQQPGHVAMHGQTRLQPARAGG